MAYSSAISLTKSRFTVERRPTARRPAHRSTRHGWGSAHLRPVKAFVHRGPDEVRSPPTGSEESPQAPIRAASSPEGGRAVSTQTRLWASQALTASLCAFQRPPFFSPRHARRSRQRGLGGWSRPGAGRGGLAGAPLRPRRVRLEILRCTGCV